MPILILYAILGIGGFYLADNILDNVRENFVQIIVIGGVAYYVYKRMK